MHLIAYTILQKVGMLGINQENGLAYRPMIFILLRTRYDSDD